MLRAPIRSAACWVAVSRPLAGVARQNGSPLLLPAALLRRHAAKKLYVTSVEAQCMMNQTIFAP